MNKTFAQQSIQFHKQLLPDFSLPNGVEWITAFEHEETLQSFSAFMNKYYADYNKRHFLFGINPGRFGAGVTGVAFTDPILLNEKLGIANQFEQKHELSALFIHEVIDQFPNPEAFYARFYITSVNPVGLLKNGINYNYYDDAETLKATEPFIIEKTEKQLRFGAHRDIAFSIGKGKNFKYFKQLNKRHKWFTEIVALPHPRWVMQYRRKNKQQHIDFYVEQLVQATEQQTIKE